MHIGCFFCSFRFLKDFFPDDLGGLGFFPSENVNLVPPAHFQGSLPNNE